MPSGCCEALAFQAVVDAQRGLAAAIYINSVSCLGLHRKLRDLKCWVAVRVQVKSSLRRLSGIPSSCCPNIGVRFASKCRV